MRLDYFDEQEAQYNTNNMMYGLIVIALIFIGLFVIWQWCSECETNKSSTNNDKLFMKPVYAHEIEPGIVVLQSEDGEYFKIMKEFDLRGTNRYGSVSCTRPEALQPNLNNTHLERALIHTESYGQPRIHDVFPSAPNLYHARETTMTMPPPYQAN